jgi:hypothetical protein
MEETEYLKSIGQVAVFYLPKEKLDSYEFLLTVTIRKMIHGFFQCSHGAYTMEESDITGFWSPPDSEDKEMIKERNVRYEVSFSGEKERDIFVKFLSQVCSWMKEDAIYLTMGYKSWLVLPKEQGDAFRSEIS